MKKSSRVILTFMNEKWEIWSERDYLNWDINSPIRTFNSYEEAADYCEAHNYYIMDCITIPDINE